MATKKTKTLLVLGDDKDFDTYEKFINQKHFFSKRFCLYAAFSLKISLSCAKTCLGRI
ncbi:MAG: hypothetical protein IIB81_05155 [Nanoarchaeota archaeon]|nr:hypothetical protein [Nanoarchaeota archaeon]